MSVDVSNKVHSNNRTLPQHYLQKKKKKREKASVALLESVMKVKENKTKNGAGRCKKSFVAATFSFMLLTFKGVVLVLVREILTFAI